MEQEKIGRFIQECRKEKKLTQNELAEKLNITNKAVSKWETGRGMPDASILLELSKILDVTVNELLSGEKLQVNEYKVKAEENIIAIAKENDKSKKIIKKVIISCMLVVIFVFTILFIKYFKLVWDSNINRRLEEFSPIFYQTIENTEESSDYISIEIDNLRFTLKGMFFDGINEEKLSNLDITQDEINKIIKDSMDAELNCLLEISTIDGSNMNELVFEHLIYDNNKNLISSNVGFINASVHLYNQFYNRYIKGVENVKEDVLTYMNKNIRKSIIRDNLNSTLFLIRAEKDTDASLDNIDLSKYHVLFTGLNYKNEQNEVINLSDKVIEFVLEK